MEVLIVHETTFMHNFMHFLQFHTCFMDKKLVMFGGLLWNRIDDIIFISGPDNTIPNSAVTKREALHYIAKVFDPLGLLVPVTFYGKLFIQNLWKFKLHWDQPLPADVMESWVHVTTLFKQIH